MMQSLLLFTCAVTSSALKMPTTVNVLVPRVVLTPLPIVYVYDHCPFCVRVRLALGLKNVKHNVYFLANDDIPTPTALIGKKIAPIFSETGSPPMPESLDIIAKVDADPKYGKVGLFKPMSDRKDINAWQKKVADTNRILQRPRYMMTCLPGNYLLLTPPPPNPLLSSQLPLNSLIIIPSMDSLTRISTTRCQRCICQKSSSPTL